MTAVNPHAIAHANAHTHALQQQQQQSYVQQQAVYVNQQGGGPPVYKQPPVYAPSPNSEQSSEWQVIYILPLSPTPAAILESYVHTTAVISLYTLLIPALAMLLHNSLGVMCVHVIPDGRDSFPSLSSLVFGCRLCMMLSNGHTITTL